MMRRRWRGWTEDGFVGGFEALPFGFLIFVSGTLLLANAWAVVDAHVAATSAATEAVRTFVESSGDPALARQAGEQAALDALAGQGKSASRAVVTWEGADLVRCQPVSVTVTYRVPTISVPWLGSFGNGLVRTSARHTEVVDPWRDGLDVDGFDAGACVG
ncbi:MAG TPA: hypothetical protein VGH94_01280 [Acidimicrobiales bacterium]